jgi:WD40 repeat protein
VTEIFVSYSRRDKPFVEKFLAALHNHGYADDQIWVDWQDIPASSKWEAEIRKGVEASNSIIFILSPEWVKSNECAKELKIALEYHKRLIPVVCQEVEPKTIPAELASLNWIFFHGTNNFDDALKTLLAALKTDLEWVAKHTNLLSRANLWEAKSRESGYLLRGNELQEAETWLSHASENTQPRPTPLQSDFIFSSRRDAMERQRRNLAWVSTALVVSIALAIAAVYAGIEALRQSQRALASQLAAQATGLVDTQPDLALLLSLESNYIGDELDETDAAWLGSLVTTLNSSPKLGAYLRGHEDAIRAVAFSPEGRWLATTGNPSDGVSFVNLWDMNSADTSQSPQKFTGGAKRFLSVAFSPNGERFAAAGDDAKLFVWDPQKCCEPVAAWDLPDRARGLAFAQVDGREYAAVATGREVTFWDVQTGEMNDSLTLQVPTEDEKVRLLSLAVAPGSAALAVGGDDGNITVWDLQTREMKFHACNYGDARTNEAWMCVNAGEGQTDIRGLAFNASGQFLIAGSSDNRAWLWDVASGKLLAHSPNSTEGGHLNTVAGVAVDPVNGQIATVSWDNTVRLWELVRDRGNWSFHRLDTLAGHSNSVWAVAFSPNGQWVATGSSDSTAILWEAEQTSQIGEPLAEMQGAVWALTTAPNGRQLAAGDEAGNIFLWDFNGESLNDSLTLTHPGGVLALAYSHDNRWLASAGYDQTIRVWEAQTGKEAWRIENAHTDEIWSLAFSPDDSLLASASFDATAKLWDAATHRQVGAPLKHDRGVYALTFNEDGTRLLTAGYASEIYLWDVTNPASLPTPSLLVGHQAAVNTVTLNPEFPALAASTSDDKTLLVWDIDFMEHTAPITGLNESMEAVTFRPDGAWLASATNNQTVLLWQLNAERCANNWNIDTCLPARLGTPLIGHRAAVNNVAFLSDTVLISSGADGELILWNLDKASWYERACNIVNRSFNASEYSQYIEGKLNQSILNTVSWFAGMFGSKTQQSAPPCLAQ